MKTFTDDTLKGIEGTLEAALWQTGAPEEIILLAMVEGIKQNGVRRTKFRLCECAPILFDTTPFDYTPFLSWTHSQQGFDYWRNVNGKYKLK